MRQRGSRRIRPRPRSRENETNLTSPVSHADPSSLIDRSNDITKRYPSADENVVEGPHGDLGIEALPVNERRTRSERAYFSDCDPSGTFPGNSAGSSSNSSLSTRSLDSPSTSLEQVHPATSSANASTSWDSDVDVEPDPSDWSQGVTEEVLARLSNSEKKRQEVINGT
ncbi:hypothetical protein HZH68_010897 [Vespula germanica]|uniref:Uncharacterized protein n=1 Tax=Vespula germanica TaxID=30212 RepID=A0A834JSJ3_VESGE|nr:hypothetical protein HZH68_010897 [Vespula germanica]